MKAMYNDGSMYIAGVTYILKFAGKNFALCKSKGANRLNDF